MGATKVMVLAAIVIVGLVAVGVRDWRVAIWLVGTTAASILCTIVLLHLTTGSLSVFHFVSLLVVAGIGMDYGLFSSSRTGQSLATRRALLACVVSTGATFAILGLSKVPVLNAIGCTVATGVTVCYLLFRFAGPALSASLRGKASG